VNERRVLIIGSSIAAWCLVTLLMFSLGTLDSEGESEGSFLWFQFRFVLPAVVSVMLSAWWQTRRHDFAQCQDGTLSARVAGWSFAICSLVLGVFSCLHAMVFIDDVSTLGNELMFAIVSAVALSFIAGIFLFLPALFAEYAVVRLARSRWARGASSGVLS
jgi:hypothetical protein